MNDNAKKWVAALRGGEYRQGFGQLVKNGRYCCLGVACEIAMRDGVELPSDWRSWCNLPYEPLRWVGLWTSFGDDIEGRSLSSLNDSGKTFAEIADIIESEPKGLFRKESPND